MLIGMDGQCSYDLENTHSQQSQALPAHLNPTQHVQVPRSKFIPCSTLVANLTSSINPLEHTHDFGRALYIATTQIVYEHIQSSINCDCELAD